MTDVVVVVPCYREQLERVQRTVESAMATRGVTQVVIVDDGAGDEQLDALHDEYACMSEGAVRVIHMSKNRGCSAALNAGIRELADDAVICRLDVGDHFYPEAKARQLEVVLSGAARCSSSPHFDPVAGEAWKIPERWDREIYRDSVFTGCTNVYRKDVWSQVGGHDESLRYCADWDFSMKVQAAVGWHIHDESTCDAGMYPDGFSARSEANPELRAVRAACRAEVTQRGRMITHPDAYAHLRNPKWRRKRGLLPL